jgi:hypothetical protein
MIGSAPAAETSGGIGVGPGDMSRYLFIIGLKVSSRAADNWSVILDIITYDGYMMGQRFYNLLLTVSEFHCRL